MLPFLRGVGTGALDVTRADLLSTLGYNAFRVWGVDQLNEPMLLRANEKRVAVVVGLWIQNVPHRDSPEEADLVRNLISQVTQWSRFQAIQMWVIGNEVELRSDEQAAFVLINKVASAIRTIDQRPTATAIAEIGDVITQHCRSGLDSSVRELLANDLHAMRRQLFRARQ